MATDKWLSNGELAELLCKDQSTISHTVKQFGLKANKYGKYSLKAVTEAFKVKQARDNKNIDPNNPKHRKTALECDILEEKLKQIRGETISLEQHYKETDEIATIVNAGLEQWVQKIAAMKRDPELLVWAKEQRDNCRRWLAEKVKA